MLVFLRHNGDHNDISPPGAETTNSSTPADE